MTLCIIARRHLVKDGQRKGEHNGTLAEDGHLCRSCHRRLERGIAELPAVTRWLALHVARNGGSGQRVSGSREAPVPVCLDVLALLGPVGHDCSAATCPGGHDPYGAGMPSIRGVLDSWVRLCCEERGLVGPKDAKLETMVVWLLARLPWFVRQPWVDEFAADLDRLYSQAHHLAPWRPPHEQPRPVPCRECDLLALYWRPPYVECLPSAGGCGQLYLQGEYDAWVSLNAAHWAKVGVA